MNRRSSALPVVHPDALDLEPDCRRVLRDEYALIQTAADRGRLVEDRGEHWVEAPNMPGGGMWARNESPRRRTKEEIVRDIASAIAEYRRVAKMWGVDVEVRS